MRQVIEKVVCGECGRFLGLITSDGCGPEFESCPAGHARRPAGPVAPCPMFARLAPYQPEPPPRARARVGNRHEVRDESDDPVELAATRGEEEAEERE